MNRLDVISVSVRGISSELGARRDEEWHSNWMMLMISRNIVSSPATAAPSPRIWLLFMMLLSLLFLSGVVVSVCDCALIDRAN